MTRPPHLPACPANTASGSRPLMARPPVAAPETKVPSRGPAAPGRPPTAKMQVPSGGGGGASRWSRRRLDGAPRGGISGGRVVASRWYLALVVGIQQCGGDWVWVGWNGEEKGEKGQGREVGSLQKDKIGGIGG
jgi:hypothetical protein